MFYKRHYVLKATFWVQLRELWQKPVPHRQPPSGSKTGLQRPLHVSHKRITTVLPGEVYLILISQLEHGPPSDDLLRRGKTIRGLRPGFLRPIGKIIVPH